MKIESLNTAYSLGAEFASVILEIYGHRLWMRAILKQSEKIRSSDYDRMKVKFGDVDDDMKAAYFYGFNDALSAP